MMGQGPSMLVPTLLEHGTEAQKGRFIPGTLLGKIRWCQGYSEPGAGSDLASLRTRAVLEGDSWVVNGQKSWTSRGRESDWMFALVRTEPDKPKHDGISYLLIDMKTPGIEVRLHVDQEVADAVVLGLPPDRHEDARHRGAAAPPDDRGRRLQRGVPRQRARAGGEPGRETGPGLGGEPLDAQARARADRRLASHPPDVRRARHAGESNRG